MKKAAESLGNCPVCDREMFSGKSVDKHHLKPKTFGGKETELLHRICHTKIHTTFAERELDHYYHTWERLLESEEIQKFVKWVQKKEPEFYSKNKDTERRRGKRRR